MPRKLSESAKKKRKTKASRVIEDGKDLPSNIKHPMIEGLYRIGWSASKIIKSTGIPQKTVYRSIKKYEESGTCGTDAIQSKAMAWARKYGSSSAAQKFNVDTDLIKEWMKGQW